MREFKGELQVAVQGTVLTSNIDKFMGDVEKFRKSLGKSLKSDDDFAQAEQDVKSCKIVETRISNAESEIMSSMEDVYKIINTLRDGLETIKDDRFFLAREIKNKKNEIKYNLISDFLLDFDNFKKDNGICEIMQIDIEPLLIDAIKGKKTIISMREACQIVFDEQKTLIEDLQLNYDKNLELLNRQPEKYQGLFSDRYNIATKTRDEVKMLIDARVARHELALIKEEAKENVLEEDKIKEEFDKEYEQVFETTQQDNTMSSDIQPFSIVLQLNTTEALFVKIRSELIAHIKNRYGISAIDNSVVPYDLNPFN